MDRLLNAVMEQIKFDVIELGDTSALREMIAKNVHKMDLIAFLPEEKQGQFFDEE